MDATIGLMISTKVDPMGVHISVPMSPATLSFAQATLFLDDLMTKMEKQWPGTWAHLKEKEHVSEN